MCICWCVTEINYKMHDATIKIKDSHFQQHLEHDGESILNEIQMIILLNMHELQNKPK